MPVSMINLAYEINSKTLEEYNNTGHNLKPVNTSVFTAVNCKPSTHYNNMGHYL